jgi:hypothetical protein
MQSSCVGVCCQGVAAHDSLQHIHGGPGKFADLDWTINRSYVGTPFEVDIPPKQGSQCRSKLTSI